jgi:hypothetical protein
MAAGNVEDAAGNAVESQVFEHNSRWETVICVLPASREASHECKTEYRTGEVGMCLELSAVNG